MSFSFSKSIFGQDKIKYYLGKMDGIYKGAIEIKLDAGWHTYWKHPGANGFKPKIVVLSQKNINTFKFYWPHPKVLGPDGYEYLGYEKGPFIPFEISKIDKEKIFNIELEFHYGVCKKVCLVKNRILKIEQKLANSTSHSEKINIAFEKVPSEFFSSSGNECNLESKANNLFKLTIKNEILKDKNKINLALIDYTDETHLITDQTFDSKEGSASAILSSETAPFVNVDINQISLTFMIDGSAKKIIGCNNLVDAVPDQSS